MQLLKQLTYKPYYLVLLPLFFTFHCYVENIGLIPVAIAAELFAYYLVAGVCLTLVFYFAFKSLFKASAFVLILLSIYLFFGSFHDYLKTVFKNSFISSYSFLLPLLFCIIIVSLLYLKRKKDFKRQGNFYRFVNILFILWILIDLFQLTFELSGRKSILIDPPKLSPLKSKQKPDVFLIVADEYAGHQELSELLNFDNSAFEQQLTTRGFHIVKDSRSNYDFTVYSIASLLNMSYLKIDRKTNVKDQSSSEEEIENSLILNFFKKAGYDIFNFSIFDLSNKKSLVFDVFNLRYRLINDQTLFSRIIRDLGYHFSAIHSFNQSKGIYKFLELNNTLYNNTIRILKAKEEKPKFVYTHLEMPHVPFYFDSMGRQRPLDSLLTSNYNNRQQYLQYLQYANRKYVSLIDAILISSKPKIIIFMSDHGYRPFNTYGKEKLFHFININAVHFPKQHYEDLYDGISNVNQFRVLLNTEFGQHLPLLKDTIQIIAD